MWGRVPPSPVASFARAERTGAAARRSVSGGVPCCNMDWIKNNLPEGLLSPPALPTLTGYAADVSDPAAAPNPPKSTAASSPNRAPPTATTASQVSSKEMEELTTILRDSVLLAEHASSGIANGTLEDTATLEALSELSSRLLCRNRSRQSAIKFGSAITGGKDNEKVAAAAKPFVPSYFRHTQTSGGEEEGGQTDLWVSKVFLHDLPQPPTPGTVLCARFSLSARDAPAGGEGEGESLYDLSFKVMQVAGPEHKYALSFGMNDVLAVQGADWTLDEGQRAKLAELQGFMGLASGRWTPVGLLGMLLSAAGCAQLDANPCFVEVIRACREAHREELLAASGSLF